MQTDGEHLTELLVVRLVEVVAFVSALGGATERRLQGERVYKVELFPHHHSRAAFSTLLNHEVAVVEAEILVQVIEHPWKDSFFEPVRVFSLRVPKHEEIVICGVAVHVAEEENVPRFQGLLHHYFRVVVYWVEFGAGSLPLPVQVRSC